MTRAPDQASPPSDEQRSAACVVYATGAPPSDLLDALIARGVDVRHECDPYGVLAGLAESRPLPTERHVPIILALVEPDTLPQLADTIDAVETAFPDTVLWQHRATSETPLSAVTTRERRAWSGRGREHENTHDEVVVRPITPPRLRLAGDSPGAPAGVPNADPPPSDTTEAGSVGLSEDELSTLLGAMPSTERHIGS